jgi:lipoprotein NlpD
MPPKRSRSQGAVRAAALPRLAVCALVLCIAACASRQPAPVEDRTPRPPPPVVVAPPPPVPEAEAKAPEADWRPQTYTVKRGDTLYQIALDHGLDYRELAAWNNVENVNVIRVGQLLRLSAPTETPAGSSAAVQTAPLRTPPPLASADAAAPPGPSPVPGARNTENYKTQPKAIKEPYSEQALRDVQRGPAPAPAAVPAPAPEPAAPPVVARVEPKPAEAPAPAARVEPPKAAPDAADGDDKVDWAWPAKGKIVTGFSEAASLKGIDIAGTSGQAVAASAGGKVVYAGTGLRGYGKLIIIKHNGTYLSAYAHNKEILVKEGQQVTRGQRIAEMGNTDADQVKLHFEIRRQGKPVDPLRYLPPA